LSDIENQPVDNVIVFPKNRILKEDPIFEDADAIMNMIAEYVIESHENIEDESLNQSLAVLGEAICYFLKNLKGEFHPFVFLASFLDSIFNEEEAELNLEDRLLVDKIASEVHNVVYSNLKANALIENESLEFYLTHLKMQINGLVRISRGLDDPTLYLNHLNQDI
jgi:hypothetical protein